jgi:hypothetical protein
MHILSIRIAGIVAAIKLGDIRMRALQHATRKGGGEPAEECLERRYRDIRDGRMPAGRKMLQELQNTGIYPV